ncbi:MAG: hypothetical protein AAF808_00255 [Cyanobacteria bacterium P01_D01_bin.2]
MNILPYKSFTLETSTPLAQVKQQLASRIEASRLVRSPFSGNHAPYQGTISDQGFDIRRTLNRRNSFVPIIQGRFEPHATGTRCHITMQLHPLVLGFMGVWLSLWCMGVIPIALFGGESPLTGLFLLVMPLGISAIFLAFFHYEAQGSQQELTKIITGREAPKPPPPPRSPRGKRNWLLGGAALSLAIVLHHLTTLHPLGLPLEQTAADCTQANPSPYCQLSVTQRLTGHPSVTTLAMDNDGQTLVSGGEDKAIRVWDVATGQLKKTLQSDSGTVQAIAMSADGNTVVSGGGDLMVRIWDLTSDQPPKMLAGHQNVPNQVAISADGKTLISTAFSEIKLWDMTTGELQITLLSAEPTEVSFGPLTMMNTSHAQPVTISPVGDKVLVSDYGKWTLWDVATRQATPLSIDAPAFAFDVDISPDGRFVVTVSYRQPITFFEVWDLTTGKLQTQGRLSSSPEKHTLNNIVVSRDNTGDDVRIIASTPKGLKSWSLQDKRLDASLATESIRSLVSNRDGTVLAGVVPGFGERSAVIHVLQQPADNSDAP